MGQIAVDLRLEMGRRRMAWLEEARAKQLTPPGEWWNTWLVMAGRGFGKTRLGAEDVVWYGVNEPETRIAVVAPTFADVQKVCFEGDSGIISRLPGKMIQKYNRSTAELTLVNGTMYFGFVATEPERLRGPQFHRAWCDEVAAWEHPDTMDMLNFGLRLVSPSGKGPQKILTTTPKPIPIISTIVNKWKTAGPEESGIIITTGSTHENKKHLAPSFFKEITQYEGTELGRQEIYGELLDMENAGIFKRKWFKLWPAKKALPRLEYIVQSWDTAFAQRTHSDPTAYATFGAFQIPNQYGKWGVMLLDCWSEKLEFPELRKKAIEEYNSEYGTPPRRPDAVLIEAKGSGLSLMQELRIAGLPIRSYNPGRADKVQRAHAVSHLFANGAFYVPESMVRRGSPRDWVEPFITQLCTFPYAQNDDYVDVATQAMKHLSNNEFVRVETIRPEWEDYVDDDVNDLANPYAA